MSTRRFYEGIAYRLVTLSLRRSQRLIVLVITYGLIWTASLALAYGIRFDFKIDEIARHHKGWLAVGLSILGRYVALFYFRLHKISWRHICIRDASRIVKAHLAAIVCVAAGLALAGIPHFPRSVVILHGMFSIFGCLGVALFVRMLHESAQLRPKSDSNIGSRDTLIIGAGESGHLLVKTLQARHQLPFRPIGVLDDNPALLGRGVFGVDVLGRVSELREILEARPKIGAVILAIPSLSKARSSEVEAVCKQVGVIFKKIQSFEEIALTDIAIDGGSTASIESVLERDVSVAHDAEIREFIFGKDVAVTGAGGSIGSELVRQLITFAPKSITLIDSNEFHMFKIQREVGNSRPEVQKYFRIASIVDEERILQILSERSPQVIFHAAAYKHVPLMEENPYEAFNNNVVGTRNLLRACVSSNVEHFVLISSDKAVNSTNVMGNSKRIGELLVQAYVEEARKRDRLLKGAIVRFGNVINSNGSVVPLFKDQILSGGPVTVTHPEMRRFFMSIREAVRLVLAAGSIGSQGEVFLLDMGSPVRIVDVAKKMLALYGRRDIEIVFSGIRPGEKLFEELTAPGEETYSTSLSKVQRVVSPHVEANDVIKWVSGQERLITARSGDAIKREMASFVGVQVEQKRATIAA
jgi:FlaA1/EpsC-like NDP-sugar epimerase